MRQVRLCANIAYFIYIASVPASPPSLTQPLLSSHVAEGFCFTAATPRCHHAVTALSPRFHCGFTALSPRCHHAFTACPHGFTTLFAATLLAFSLGFLRHQSHNDLLCPICLEPSILCPAAPARAQTQPWVLSASGKCRNVQGTVASAGALTLQMISAQSAPCASNTT